MFNLLIKGFNTKEEALAFAKWYEGQGEQDAATWFECRKQEGSIKIDFMPVDCNKDYEFSEDTVTMFLRNEEVLRGEMQ